MRFHDSFGEAQTIPPGQHDIEHESIIRLRRGKTIALIPIPSRIDDESLGFEPFFNEREDPLPIFSYKHSSLWLNQTGKKRTTQSMERTLARSEADGKDRRKIS